MKPYITLLDLLADTPIPVGLNEFRVEVNYRQPDGVQYLTRIRIQRQADQKLAAYCDCGKLCDCFCHHPAGRGLRCMACLQRCEQIIKKQNAHPVTKIARRGKHTKSARKLARKKAA